MPRPPRIDQPGIAQHVAQRGNDRQPCVFAAADHPRYLTDLREPAAQAGVASHAYVLMTNRVHLLTTPPQADLIGRLMQALGRRCVRYVDERWHRTGTLWAGRYESCPVGDRGRLLQRTRFIEPKPVRTAMVACPDGHPWSSYRHTAPEWDEPRSRRTPGVGNWLRRQPPGGRPGVTWSWRSSHPSKPAPSAGTRGTGTLSAPTASAGRSRPSWGCPAALGVESRHRRLPFPRRTRPGTAL